MSKILNDSENDKESGMCSSLKFILIDTEVDIKCCGKVR